MIIFIFLFFFWIPGKASSVPEEVFWMLLFFTLVFLIVIILILFCKCKKKHGKYKVVPDRANDGSDGSLPLTTKHKGVQA